MLTSLSYAYSFCLYIKIRIDSPLESSLISKLNWATFYFEYAYFLCSFSFYMPSFFNLSSSSKIYAFMATRCCT